MDNKIKFEKVYKTPECTSIWKYDLSKFTNGPISVEHKWNQEYLKELELKQKRGR